MPHPSIWTFGYLDIIWISKPWPALGGCSSLVEQPPREQFYGCMQRSTTGLRDSYRVFHQRWVGAGRYGSGKTIFGGRDATSGSRTDDVRMPLPQHPDEGISIGRGRHPDERIFRYPLQALLRRRSSRVDVFDDGGGLAKHGEPLTPPNCPQ